MDTGLFIFFNVDCEKPQNRLGKISFFLWESPCFWSYGAGIFGSSLSACRQRVNEPGMPKTGILNRVSTKHST